MDRKAVIAATLRGLFCMGFSGLVGWLTTALSMGARVLVSFVSAFCGSLFARFVLKGDGR
ncbi:hypothetical protein [Maliponia aquimaris]|uniref:Uncharacterized protein n=1 Tax=Maliponia aquimaris TaxID=1673631 RepID=A0A238L532_9RHOB|nr:hypothetical protein [Maliponia aquimaris]SMX50097.1 hypothetical protein MAA8898_04600 [Maliponia aquimaris]